MCSRTGVCDISEFWKYRYSDVFNDGWEILPICPCCKGTGKQTLKVSTFGSKEPAEHIEISCIDCNGKQLSANEVIEIFKQKGVNIQYVLDVGAYHGTFTNTIHSVWPTAIIKQFEADERQKKFLQKDAFITLLGDEFKTVNFYTIPEDKITTGSSIYKENTSFYTWCGR